MPALLTLLNAALCLAPAAPGDTVRIDCGSTQPYRTMAGQLFLADQYFTNGRAFSNAAIADITGTTDDALYRTERSAPTWLPSMRYEIPVPAGDYLVRLHLAELYHGATGGGPGTNGQRVFSVRLEGRRTLINYDLHAGPGAMAAVVKEYHTAITDGFATIDFLPVQGEPTIAAIEVLRQPTGTAAAPCAWVPQAPGSLGRKEGQCALVAGHLYTFGGYTAGLQATSFSERYNPATDQWATLPPMPLATTHTAAAQAGTSVWIIGGYVGNWPGVVTSAVQVYDTQTGTWRMGPPLPLPRGSGAAALVGRQLHFFGGVEPDIETNSSLHFVLDLDNEAAGWRQAAPLPQPRCHLSGASLGGKVYAIGGQFGHNRSVLNTPLLHEYDPLSDTWTRRADLPTPLSHFEGTVTVLDGQLYIVGGNDNYTPHEDVLRYTPGSNQWSQVCELPTPLLGAFAKVLGNTLIVAQGEVDGAAGPITTTRITTLSRTPSTVLSFSRNQLAAQLMPGATTTLPNLLWTLSGTASYTLATSSLPAWLRLPAGAGSGTADPLGQPINFRVDAAGLAPGTYTATVQAAAPGYTPATATITLTVAMPSAAAAGQPAARPGFAPNPTTDNTTLHFTARVRQVARIEVYNALGQLVWQDSRPATAGENHTELPTHLLAAGSYLVRVQLREGMLPPALLLKK